LAAVRRRVLLVAALVLVASLAACGGSGGSSDANAQAQIKSAYAKFFAGKTAVSDRVALLQDGSRFKPVIQSFASNPLAKNVSASVSSVTLEGQDKAKVVYVVKFAGSALPKQTGTAVKQDGTWKVGYASLCRLVSLQGSTPSACKS
jgi:hypothetical protein